MPSENERRHTEVHEFLTSDEAPQRRALRSYWGSANSGLEREHAREEAAIDKRLERMKTRSLGFAALQTQ